MSKVRTQIAHVAVLCVGICVPGSTAWANGPLLSEIVDLCTAPAPNAAAFEQRAAAHGWSPIPADGNGEALHPFMDAIVFQTSIARTEEVAPMSTDGRNDRAQSMALSYQTNRQASPDLLFTTYLQHDTGDAFLHVHLPGSFLPASGETAFFTCEYTGAEPALSEALQSALKPDPDADTSWMIYAELLQFSFGEIVVDGQAFAIAVVNPDPGRTSALLEPAPSYTYSAFINHLGAAAG